MAGGAHAVSSLTLNRLSLYLRVLRHLREEGVETISSQGLAGRLDLSAAQIRKDLTHFGEFGVRGVGYRVADLTARLNQLLGLDRTHPIIIVGSGNLGQALAHFLNFADRSFRVVAAVDNDPEKIGRKVGEVTIESSQKLAAVVHRSGAEIAVLTVPRKAAQKNYDELVAAGIRAVLNFAPVRLESSPLVPTKSVDLRVFLEELGFYLSFQSADSRLEAGGLSP